MAILFILEGYLVAFYMSTSMALRDSLGGLILCFFAIVGCYGLGAIAGLVALHRMERWLPIAHARRSPIWIWLGVLAASLAVVILGAVFAAVKLGASWFESHSAFAGWLGSCSLFIAAFPAYFLLQFFGEAVLEGFGGPASPVAKPVALAAVALLYVVLAAFADRAISLMHLEPERLGTAVTRSREGELARVPVGEAWCGGCTSNDKG